jgi:rhodanese-related sulfurtransferase
MKACGMRKLLCIALVLWTAMAGAQTTSGKGLLQSREIPASLHDTLKDIPAAGLSCRNESVPAKVSAGPSRAVALPDPACATMIDQLPAFLGKPEMVLLDLRPKNRFDAVHIDGSVNFGVADIRTKSYLADKLLFLVGEGKGEQELYALCAELKAAGFRKTRVLRGGLLSWMLDNRPVIGRSHNAAELARIDEAELFQESRAPGSLMIALSDAQSLADVLPLTARFPSANTEGIKEFIQKRKNEKGLRNIILIADERFDMQQWPELANAARPLPLLVYAGTGARYRQFLSMQNALWAKQAKGPNKPTCGS